MLGTYLITVDKSACIHHVTYIKLLNDIDVFHALLFPCFFALTKRKLNGSNMNVSGS